MAQATIDNSIPAQPAGNVVQLQIKPRPVPPVDRGETVYSDDIDKKSDIIRAAVIYTANQGAFDGAFHADHTDNLVLAGGYLADRHTRLRDSALRRLTRHTFGGPRPSGRWNYGRSPAWRAFCAGTALTALTPKSLSAIFSVRFASLWSAIANPAPVLIRFGFCRLEAPAMTLERPMFPPSRRGFLAMTAGAAIVPTMAIAAPASPLQGPYSPALVDASLALQESHEALKAASAVNDAAEAKAEAWVREHPQPKSRKGIRKWIKKASKVNDALVRPSWLELLSAEEAFAAAQIRLAKVTPADERDLLMMACHAVIYDEVTLTRQNSAPISRVVAYHLLKFRLPGMA